MNHSTGSISLSSLRSLQSTSSSEAPHRFQSTPVRATRAPFCRTPVACRIIISTSASPPPECLQAIPQTMLGGNMRLSASDAALISLSAASRASPPRVQQRPRTRDPILGCVPEDPTLPRAMTSSASSETVFRYGSRTVSFPARGSIASIGDPFEATKHVSRKKQQLEYANRMLHAARMEPHGALAGHCRCSCVHRSACASSGRQSASDRDPPLLACRYELWCEQQKRSNAEAQLRTVVVHGRSKPPWIGEVEERPGLMPIFTR